MNAEHTIDFFYTLIIDHTTISHEYALLLNALCNTIVTVVLAYLFFKIGRGFAISIVNKLAAKTKTNFDNILIQNKTFINLFNLLIFYIASTLTGILYVDYPLVEMVASRATNVLTVVLAIWTIRSVLQSIKDYLKTLELFKDKPIESYIQVFLILLWIIGIILIFAILTGKPLLQFFIGLGTISAVLLLLFKDTILGFVASIQVSVNDMVRIGDWITMEKHGADGNVIEINLVSVKVRNFDNTITTIPTYYLISDSFKNWRGMSESDGRRIKRSVIIQASSIFFLTPKDVDKLKQIELINTYLCNKENEINTYNTSRAIDKSLLINGRNLTNFGVFRKYLDNYLTTHTAINQDMTLMIRQLEQTPQGIPLEVYCFSSDKVWQNYEYIMSDIFDHILASVSYFDLDVYQLQATKPTSSNENL